MMRYLLLAALLLASPVSAAEWKAVKVCDNKTLAASTTTLCDPVDVSRYRYFSYQYMCNETTEDSMQIDLDFVAGWGAVTGVLVNPYGLAQLVTNSATENTWSAVTEIDSGNPLLLGVATLKFTEDLGDLDIVCSAWLFMGD